VKVLEDLLGGELERVRPGPKPQGLLDDIGLGDGSLLQPERRDDVGLSFVGLGEVFDSGGGLGEVWLWRSFELPTAFRI
jgi:hypothetical protein